MKLDRAAIFLLAIGLLQMAGDLTGIAAVKGIGAATAASPAPKVFSAVKGLETYSSRFFIECAHSPAGETLFHREITPRIYARMRGPYNRRNVFGAVLAYGPVLASEARARRMFDAVSRYAICRRTLLDELEIQPPRECGTLRVRVVPREGSNTGNLPLVLVPPCD
jgi:hypothetical protein